MTQGALIGVGSPFGADSVAWDIIDRIELVLPIEVSRGIQCQRLDRPGPALLNHLRDCEWAIVVDAVQDGVAPGRVIPVAEQDLNVESRTLSTHGLGLAQTLALGRQLGNMPQLHVLGVEVGADPSRELARDEFQRALEAVAEYVARQAHSAASGTPSPAPP